MKKSSWFIFFLILAVSCLDDPDCFRLNNNVVGFAFRVIGTNRADTVRLTRVDVTGLNGFYPDTVTSSVFVPINFTTTASTVTFSYEDGTTKYVDLEYLLKSQFISEDCGSRYELSDLRALNSDIDSIRVINGSPNKAAGAINIELLRCPNPRYVGVAFFDMLESTNSNIDVNVRSASLAVDRITRESDGLEIYAQSSRTLYYLPIDLNATETIFNFYTRGGDPDVPQKLRLTYTKRPQNSFPGLCDEVQLVTNLTISDVDSALATVDSLGINENNEFLSYLTDPPSSNVRLFRCQLANLVRVDFRRRTSNVPGSENTRADTIAIKRITSDYGGGNVYVSNVRTRSVTLPVNPDEDRTVFYIEYDDSATPTDTVRFSYTRTPLGTTVLYCGNVNRYTNLANDGSAANITVAPSTITGSDRINNPPTYTNIQVVHEAVQ
jgi:hypothetical protein